MSSRSSLYEKHAVTQPLVFLFKSSKSALQHIDSSTKYYISDGSRLSMSIALLLTISLVYLPATLAASTVCLWQCNAAKEIVGLIRTKLMHEPLMFSVADQPTPPRCMLLNVNPLTIPYQNWLSAPTAFIPGNGGEPFLTVIAFTADKRSTDVIINRPSASTVFRLRGRPILGRWLFCISVKTESFVVCSPAIRSRTRFSKIILGRPKTLSDCRLHGDVRSRRVDGLSNEHSRRWERASADRMDVG
jgi:hypothetical protein